MRRIVPFACVLLALLLGGATARPAAAQQPLSPEQAGALATRAFTYGYPLLEFLRVRGQATDVRCPDRRGRAPVNAFSHFTRFATPVDRAVVAPNVDTLYSVAQLDLGKGPVVLSHPNMGKRYFVFQLLDPYTNTIGYVGSRTTGPKAGRFAITWRKARGKRRKGVKRILSPSRRVWVIGRTLARGERDQHKAIRLMRKAALKPPGGELDFAASCQPGPVSALGTPGGLRFIRTLNRGLAQNPPPKRDRPELAALAAIGVGADRDPARAGLSPRALLAVARAINTARGSIDEVAQAGQLGAARAAGGWALPQPQIGAYGTDYAYRAGVAALGLGANTPAEAVYPTALTDAAGAPLDGSRAYRVTFPAGGLPPQRAFWSLTAYDGQGRLVRNPQRRYAVGSTHRPFVKRPDGSVVVQVSRTDPGDPSVNWLPAPEGPFRLTLRLYEPRRAALDGRWRPPPVLPVG